MRGVYRVAIAHRRRYRWQTRAARVTKTAVSAALPVVGSILSDAASTLAAAAGTLKATIGIFGLLAVAAICLPPVLTLRRAVFRL